MGVVGAQTAESDCNGKNDHGGDRPERKREMRIKIAMVMMQYRYWKENKCISGGHKREWEGLSNARTHR